MAAKALALVLCALSLSDATETSQSPSDGAYPDSACFFGTRGFASERALPRDERALSSPRRARRSKRGSPVARPGPIA